MAGMSDAVRERALGQAPLFRELNDQQRREIGRHATRHRANKGTPIIEEGDSESSFLIILLSGRANVIIAGPRGREIIVASIGEHGVAGEIGLLDGSPRSATVRAEEATEYLKVGAQDFLECMRSSAAFAEKVAKHVAFSLRCTNEQLRVIATLPAKQRVAWCLRLLGHQRGTPHNGGLVLERHPLHRDIADMTGCSRETVTRKLQKLEQEGCVTHDADRLIINISAINRALRHWTWLIDPGV